MQRHFSCADFYCAAYLIATGYEIVDYYRSGGFTTFVFNETPELHDLVKKYYTESCLIEPVQFGRTIKNLKSLIHTSTSSNNYAKGK